MVYDCGTLQSRAPGLINKRIDEFFSKGEVIDFLVISHFHEDHMNGINRLLERCNVKRLYLPFLSKEASRLIRIGVLAEKLEGWKTVLKYLDLHDQKESKIRETAIYYILEKGQEETNLEQLPQNIVRSGVNLLEKYYKDRESFYLRWYYVPYNLSNKKMYDELVEKLQKIFKGKDLFEELENFCDNRGSKKTKDWETIKKVYKDIQGRGAAININSLLFYSGTCRRIGIVEETIEIWNDKDKKRENYEIVNREISPFYLRESFYDEVYPMIKPGCLYNGDYLATNHWKPLRDAFEKYWNEIGCIQIPHHGSEHGFHENFLEMHGVIYIASAGNGNSHHHPSLSVLNHFWKKRKVLYVVTEEEGLKQTIYLYW